MQLAWKLGVVAVIALALAVLSIVFLTAIALLGYRLYRQYHLDIDTLEPNVRLALYGSIGLAILTVVATDRLFDTGGAGIILWFALLALCSYGIYWVWLQYRSYS